ncbi:MAG: 30S ribosome-binding factor RbfA [Deltaproteobacteria bacterium]|jgi:ribosome-binding factor A|nr:30S ribosome-binding factor RbfA [Deltaproteobacteria bacterium]
MGRVRQERINSLIETTVAELLLKKCKDPRLSLVTITRAKVALDLKKVRVFYSVLGPAEERSKVQKALDGARGFVRRQLFEALAVKHIPEVVFEFDHNPEYASRINGLLADLGLGSPPPSENDFSEGSSPESASSEIASSESINGGEEIGSLTGDYDQEFGEPDDMAESSHTGPAQSESD